MTSGVEKAQAIEDLAQPLTNLRSLGTTLVVAPHPDDESLGCGGTIARLRQLDLPVYVLFVSDGTLSHPNSPSYPADRLRDLRETEALAALHILGVPEANATFMRQKDRQVLTPDQPGFEDTVQYVTRLLAHQKPDTILVPWRRDPHPDHRASWQLVHEAVTRVSNPPRVLEYLIWLWELGDGADMPREDEVTGWRVAIDTVMAQRDQAIAAHRSQVTRLIDDDPAAFYLSPELLTHFARPRELFLEQKLT
ncbi:PIG-L deacetylase family protein [Spirosoma sp. KUDC1026]|uniref:PIG-L deacetylase family protein n=1 Tax=Spirosoma sp. KUDC1026 TaxID=2745947 RepID=UPI00159B8D3D|nr:PIG-L deacetylase family protein [Spirosoma sp. KUDC1026]QKZ13973.1 PIG-L family deacetylase [Spirosoma sp. KUDC1026]